MSVMRLKLARGEALRSLSRQAFMALVRDAASRAELPVAHDNGSRPRVTAGPPLSLGLTSRCEYLDFVLCAPIGAREFGRRLDTQLPEGARVLWQRRLSGHIRNPMASIGAFLYTVVADVSREDAAKFNRAKTWPYTRVREKGIQEMDIKRNVANLTVGPGKVTFKIEMGNQGTPKAREVMASVFGLTPGEAEKLPIERTAARFNRSPSVHLNREQE